MLVGMPARRPAIAPAHCAPPRNNRGSLASLPSHVFCRHVEEALSLVVGDALGLPSGHLCEHFCQRWEVESHVLVPPPGGGGACIQVVVSGRREGGREGAGGGGQAGRQAGRQQGAARCGCCCSAAAPWCPRMHPPPSASGHERTLARLFVRPLERVRLICN